MAIRLLIGQLQQNIHQLDLNKIRSQQSYSWESLWFSSNVGAVYV